MTKAKSQRRKDYNIVEGNYAEIGVSKWDDTVYFTFEGEKERSCAIVLYAHSGKEIRIQVPNEYCIGALRSVGIKGLNWKKYDYNYEIDGKIVFDPHANKVIGREKWADLSRTNGSYQVRAGFDFEEFDWENDRFPEIPREQMLLYKLNVRSYTMDGGAAGRKKGTFAGLMERIPYLEELGVTSLELMPVYEFEELMLEECRRPDTTGWSENAKEGARLSPEDAPSLKINCWGYIPGDYFAPKASYSSIPEASVELKMLIRELHRHKMECILEMYFDEKMNQNIVVEILRYWVREYHVDGFHLLGAVLPVNAMGQDLMLRRTKLFATGFDMHLFEEETYPHLYVYNDEFMYAARKQLCRAENNLSELLNQLKRQNRVVGFVNYITSNNGFTLADLFSYERKHNEDNGEDNRDGADWNFSSNGGVEGPSRRRIIVEHRKKMMRNAITLVLLGQGVPMLLGGDEFGNSQKGNNNCYCQDNKQGWINWRTLRTNHSFFEYVRQLVAFRKYHPILSSDEPMHMNDYAAKGYPDLSYHGEHAWLSVGHLPVQSMGLLYCGPYAKRQDGEEDDYIFVGLNFFVGQQSLALPKLPRGVEWHQVIDTANKEMPFFVEPKTMESRTQIVLSPQSIVILVGKKTQKQTRSRS